jgi:hypothetical protein
VQRQIGPSLKQQSKFRELNARFTSTGTGMRMQDSSWTASKICIIISIVTCNLDLTCKFTDLQKYLHKRWIVTQMEKFNGVIYLWTEVVLFLHNFVKDNYFCKIKKSSRSVLQQAVWGRAAKPRGRRAPARNDQFCPPLETF